MRHKRGAAVSETKPAIYTPVVLLLISVVGISYMGIGFVMPLRALYGREIGASSFEIGLMASSALLAGFFAGPPIGRLSDRFGHANILWLGLFIHTLLVLAYISVQNPIALIGLRMLEGVAITAVLPPARALMNAIAPPSRQGEGASLLSAAQMVGILIGPVIGTVLAGGVGYIGAFLVASVPLGLGAIAARIFLPHREASTKSERATLATTAADRRALFSNPMRLIYVLQVILGLGNGVVAAIWSIYMQDRGASLFMIGLSYTTFAIPIIIVAPLSGRLSDQRGRYWPIVISSALFGGIISLYGLPLSPLAIIIVSLLEGLATAIGRSAVDGLLADVMPAHAKGQAQANYTAAGSAGAFIGATGSGLLYAVSPGVPFLTEGAIFFVLTGALCLPGVVRLFPARRFPSQTHTPESLEVLAE